MPLQAKCNYFFPPLYLLDFRLPPPTSSSSCAAVIMRLGLFHPLTSLPTSGSLMLPRNIKEPGFFDFEHLAKHTWRWKLILWKSNTTPKKCLRHSSTAGLWRLLTCFLAKLGLEPKAVWLCMTLRFKSPIAELYCWSSVSDNLVYSNQRGKAAWHFGIFW